MLTIRVITRPILAKPFFKSYGKNLSTVFTTLLQQKLGHVKDEYRAYDAIWYDTSTIR
jgi:hypothetical protein